MHLGVTEIVFILLFGMISLGIVVTGVLAYKLVLKTYLILLTTNLIRKMPVLC